MNNEAQVAIRMPEAQINITWQGTSADLPHTVPWDATDAEIKQWAAESVANGFTGMPADPNVDLTNFMVDRYPASEAVPYNRYIVRPKTAFGTDTPPTPAPPIDSKLEQRKEIFARTVMATAHFLIDTMNEVSEQPLDDMPKPLHQATFVGVMAAVAKTFHDRLEPDLQMVADFAYRTLQDVIDRDVVRITTDKSDGVPRTVRIEVAPLPRGPAS